MEKQSMEILETQIEQMLKKFSGKPVTVDRGDLVCLLGVSGFVVGLLRKTEHSFIEKLSKVEERCKKAVIESID